PRPVTTVVRGLVLALSALAAWRGWRHVHDERLRLVELTGLVLIATFLAHGFAWPHYGLYVVPVLVAVVRADSPTRSWTAAAGTYGIGGNDVRVWFALAQPGYLLLRFTLGFLLLLVALAVGVWCAGRAGEARHFASSRHS